MRSTSSLSMFPYRLIDLCYNVISPPPPPPPWPWHGKREQINHHAGFALHRLGWGVLGVGSVLCSLPPQFSNPPRGTLKLRGFTATEVTSYNSQQILSKGNFCRQLQLTNILLFYVHGTIT